VIASPVFIVGSPRSGTSILVVGLREAGYGGFNEGNFLSLLHTVPRTIDQHFAVFGTTDKRVLTAHVDQHVLKHEFFRSVKRMVEAEHGDGPWLDKTGNPEMIEAIPVLRFLWPTCRFVFARRRAIENVMSRLEKFPAHDFAYHCADWARNMAAWRQVRARIPAFPGIEIDQQDIGADPAGTAARLGEFLGLAPGAVAAMARAFAEQRPQETAPGTAGRILSLEETGWDERQIKVFRARCVPEMLAYGYTLDCRYRLA
jgi:hypothetical protein